MTGSVKGESYVGGFIGSVDEATLVNCYFSGTVEGSDSYIGGFWGEAEDDSSISYCFSNGDVRGGNYVGGFIGNNLYVQAPIKYCYATCNVSGDRFVGGFIGQNSWSEVEYCYAAGEVQGSTDVGGFNGKYSAPGFRSSNKTKRVSPYSNAIYKFCYYDKEKSGQENGIGTGSSDIIIALTTQEMLGLEAENTMSELFAQSGVWVARADEATAQYYPQLSVFANSSDEAVRDASLASVKIAKQSTNPSVPINYLKVILPETEGVTTDPVAGDYFIRETESFSFTITPDKYHRKDTIVVTTGRHSDGELKPYADGKYTVPDIRQAIHIRITLKPYVDPVGNESLTEKTRIWAADGLLHLSLTQTETIIVYTITGQLVQQVQLSAGDTTLPLGKGVYFVRTSGGQTVKVQI